MLFEENNDKRIEERLFHRRRSHWKSHLSVRTMDNCCVGKVDPAVRASLDPSAMPSTSGFF